MIPGGVFDPASTENKIKKLENKTYDSGFWDDRNSAEKIMGDLKRLHGSYDPWKKLMTDFNDTYDLYIMARDEADESLSVEIEKSVTDLEKRFENLKLLEMLKGKYDKNNAFLTIHSGAGGTEACDWVQMLLRMFTRWCENHDYKVKILDLLEAEGGLKSVTIQIEGDYAYGYLQGETGIHRLVRISPFDSGKRRHTSFASVYCSPVIDDDIEFEIKPDDIRIDTYRASGAGGQHVNKTDSAVRITHIETGIVVQCQNERSQHKNKAMALKVLKSRLYEYYSEEKEKEQEKHAQEKKDISWGNQIRSYVFHPYNMVKDHRTKYEVGNAQGVMGGDLDGFIESYLKWRWFSE